MHWSNYFRIEKMHRKINIIKYTYFLQKILSIEKIKNNNCINT